MLVTGSSFVPRHVLAALASSTVHVEIGVIFDRHAPAEPVGGSTSAAIPTLVHPDAGRPPDLLPNDSCQLFVWVVQVESSARTKQPHEVGS